MALHDISAGEELTLDYAGYFDERAEPFPCHCSAPQCHRIIGGTPGNSAPVRAAVVIANAGWF